MNTGFIKVDDVEKMQLENPDGNSNPQDNSLSSKDPRIGSSFRTMEVTAFLRGTDAANNDLYSYAFHVANIRCFLIEAREKHEAVGGTAAAVTVVRVPFESANKPGESMLASTFDLTATAAKVQWRLGSTPLSAIQLNPGDAISLRPSGDLTGVKHLTITCLLGYNEKDIPTGPSVSAHLSGI